MTPIETYSPSTAYASKANVVNPNPYKIVCIGDSLTGHSSIVRPFYPDYLAEMFGGYAQIIETGVQGNRTDQVLARLTTDVLAYKPRECIIEVGINDANQSISVATATGNLASIYAAVRGAGITAKAVLLAPCAGLSGWDATKEAARQAISAWIRAEGIEFADPDDKMADFTDPDLPELKAIYDLSDGIHPNAAGAEALAKVVFEDLYSGGPLGQLARGLI